MQLRTHMHLRSSCTRDAAQSPHSSKLISDPYAAQTPHASRITSDPDAAQSPHAPKITLDPDAAQSPHPSKITSDPDAAQSQLKKAEARFSTAHCPVAAQLPSYIKTARNVKNKEHG
eukprot:357523-Chlamydomonas_euryale.AAC.12